VTSQRGSDALARPVAKISLWYLTRVNWILGSAASGGVEAHLIRSGGSASSCPSGASGHHLTVECDHLAVGDQRTWFEVGDTWTASSDQILGVVRTVGWTSMSGRPELGCSESPMTLFHGGSYLSPMAGSSSLSRSSPSLIHHLCEIGSESSALLE
jgi:hypothetical protein